MKKFAFILALVQMLCIFSSSAVFSADMAVLDSVEFQDSKIGVFCENDTVKLDFKFADKIKSVTSYRFEIEDVWQRKVTEGTFTIPVGKEVATLELGKFNVGWYKVVIFENEKPMDNYIAFSVLHQPSKRDKYESTPFAGVAASEYDSLLRVDATPLAKAMKSAGITYVRNVGEGWLANGDPQVKRVFDEYGISESSYHDGNALRYNLSVSTPAYMAFTSDLLSIYNNWKKISKANGGYAEAIEILNEIDIGFYSTTGTSDNFAAFTKAAAIGIADSTEGNPLAIMNGWASNSTTGFITWALQNDITKYSAAYNYHTHDDSFLRLSSGVNAANAYGDEYMPVWGTEVGTPVYLEGDQTHPDDELLLKETGHVVRKTIQHIAKGASKVFSFTTRPYLENGKNYGYFASPEWLPYPTYSSLSAMTYILGKGIIKGELKNINEETTGYLFDDGSGNDVAVLWSQNQCYTEILADKVTYMDMVGYEQEKVDEDGDGKIRLCVTSDPTYIKFNGRSNLENYYPFEYKAENNREQKKFTTAERIILQPLWGDKDPKSIREIGHYVYADKTTDVTLEVYNLNNTAVSGKVDIICSDDLIFNKKTASYSLEPWSKTEIVFKVRADKDCPTGTSSYIKFAGRTDKGEDLSNCVSKYYVNNGPRTVAKEDMVVFEEVWNTGRWFLGNHGSNVKITAHGNEEDGTITINQVVSGGDNWGFPWYKVKDTSVLEGSSGVVFEMKNTGHIANSTYSGEQIQMFIHMKDGRQYKVNYSVPKSRDWVQIVYPWSTFYLFSSPEGMFENQSLDLKDVEGISIGSNSSDIRTIRNFGIFYSDLDSDKLTFDKTVKFSGMEENAHYNQGDSNLVLIGQLPEDVITGVKVFNGRTKIENYKVEDDKIIIDFTKAEKGKYNIQVCAENQYNFQYMNNFTFYID